MINANTSQTKEKKISSYKIKLISNLFVAQEDRAEEVKGAYPGGRFKRYIDILKTYFQPLMIVNLLTMLFALPIIASLLFFEIFGYEEFGYLLVGIGISDTPFLLNEFGLGLSSGLSINSASSIMLKSYMVLLGSIGLFLPVIGVGLAGNFYVCSKLVWGETLLMKKDKYGNDVPRIIKEFFKGVKLFSGKMVFSTSIFGIIFVGTAFMILEFSNSFLIGTTNPGHYIGLIITIMLSVFSAMIMTTYLPFNVSYKNIKVLDRLKNSSIIASGFSVSSFLAFVFSIFPFALLFVGDMVKLIITIVILSFGLSHFCLVLTNYADYNSENLIQPLYQQEIKAQLRAERKRTKKVETHKQVYKNKK